MYYNYIQKTIRKQMLMFDLSNYYLKSKSIYAQEHITRLAK